MLVNAQTRNLALSKVQLFWPFNRSHMFSNVPLSHNFNRTAASSIFEDMRLNGYMHFFLSFVRARFTAERVPKLIGLDKNAPQGSSSAWEPASACIDASSVHIGPHSSRLHNRLSSHVTPVWCSWPEMLLMEIGEGSARVQRWKMQTASFWVESRWYFSDRKGFACDFASSTRCDGWTRAQEKQFSILYRP